ncbi:hypothetical protein PIB30_082392, partial [Stylosanthes scabra]|nr:hypothetical protein [Stylosanthes scabra]
MVTPTQGQVRARQLKSWELILPSEGWKCEGDDVESNKASKEVPERVGNAKEIEEEDKDEGEEEEDPKEEASEEDMPVVPRPMDVDADEDYLQYLEEVRRHP